MVCVYIPFLTHCSTTEAAAATSPVHLMMLMIMMTIQRTFREPLPTAQEGMRPPPAYPAAAAVAGAEVAPPPEVADPPGCFDCVCGYAPADMEKE